MFKSIWFSVYYNDCIYVDESTKNYFRNIKWSNSLAAIEFLSAKLVIKVKWSSPGMTWNAECSIYLGVIKMKVIDIRKGLKSWYVNNLLVPGTFHSWTATLPYNSVTFSWYDVFSRNCQQYADFAPWTSVILQHQQQPTILLRFRLS